MLDALVQSRRGKKAVKSLLSKLLKKQMRPPRVMVFDKRASYPAAKKELVPGSSTAGTKASTSERRTRGGASVFIQRRACTSRKGGART